MSRVYLQKLKDPDIHAALAASFPQALRDIGLKGDEKVLIKPNLVNSSPAASGVTTDPKILCSLISLLQEEGLSEICIGESSIENTDLVLRALGRADLERLGARVINFDQEPDGWVTVESPLHLALQRFRVARAVRDCDLIISAAKMKTHCETGVTLSVKNLLGTISPQDRQAAHRTNIHRAIVDVYSYFCQNKRIVSVVDALWALEGRRGPITGTPVPMNLLVSGADPLAVDAACVEIMGGSAADIPHLALARDYGLGELNFSVHGEQIETVRRDFDMPPLLPEPWSRLASYALLRVFKKRSYLRFEDRCTGCGACVSSCPVGAMRIEEGRAMTSQERCIGCLVCIECCKEGALDYRMRNFRTFRAARGLYQLLNRV